MAEGKNNSNNENILIVDDTPDSLKLLNDILSARGYLVRPASNGNLALRSARVHMPSLILLDIKMPEIDGFEVCRQLKADPKTREVPVIFISVLENEEEKVKGFQLGAVDFISKPFYAEEVIARVKTHLALRQLRFNIERRNLALQAAHDKLDGEVKERSAELKKINQALQIQVERFHRAEAALEESEARYHLIVETANEGIWGLDENFRTVFVNNQMADLLGYPKAEMLNQPAEKFMVEEGLSENLMKSKDRWKEFSGHFERQFRRKDGEQIWILISATPIFDSAKRYMGFFAMLTDITARKQAEEILKRDNEYLENLVKEKSKELLVSQEKAEEAKRLADIGTLASTVAHELRSPLTAIKIAAYNIRRKLKYGESVDKHVNTIERKVEEGDQIINNLLFHSRLKFPHFEQVNIAEVISGVVQNTYKQRHNAVLVMNLDDIKELSIEGDYFQLNELFTNLLNNAYDAVPNKEGEIKISSCRSGDSIMVQINDNGKGIERENLHKIFDPFFSTKSKGTGLGLSVCKQVVDLHNGVITVNSEKNQGTTITVSFPLRCKDSRK